MAICLDQILFSVSLLFVRIFTLQSFGWYYRFSSVRYIPVSSFLVLYLSSQLQQILGATVTLRWYRAHRIARLETLLWLVDCK